jgi:anaerobic dimethyl sulfoxide reductase subunit A
VNHGVLCPKGRAAPELLYHLDRLKHPLKRIGEKGAGQWIRISWDEALDTVADRMAHIRDAYGPEQVAFIQGSALPGL